MAASAKLFKSGPHKDRADSIAQHMVNMMERRPRLLTWLRHETWSGGSTHGKRDVALMARVWHGTTRPM